MKQVFGIFSTKTFKAVCGSRELAEDVMAELVIADANKGRGRHGKFNIVPFRMIESEADISTIIGKPLEPEAEVETVKAKVKAAGAADSTSNEVETVKVETDEEWERDYKSAFSD